MASARKTPLPFPAQEDLTGRTVGRFVIRSKLGTGGMGEVYYAEDSELQRPVALKRVSGRLGSDPAARRRILQEAQRASALSSEHIASVYDVFEDFNELFLVMEYVEGTTLRRRLQTVGRLSLSSSLSIALQCAEALSEAQHKGIVHRDIKPENIMLTPAGHIKILDFGLAHQVPAGGDAAATVSGETWARACVGTSGYMAPEVLLEKGADARSDIFSLGIVFYEVLTGGNPFLADKALATADRILHSQPPTLREAGVEVPERLEGIFTKMLAKDPEERYASAADLVLDLREVEQEISSTTALAAHPPSPWRKYVSRRAVSLLLVVLALSVFPGLWPHKVPLPEKKNLAVLPFVPAGEDPGARAFCRGLTETLTAKLGQLTEKYPVEVVSPSEVRAQSATSVEAARSGLGVNLVLEGSFHQSATNMRVSYDLVDARTHRVLRADTITAAADDPFALEDRVVDSALRALDVELGAEQRRSLTAHGTNEPAAYDFYLRGRGYLQDYQKPENIDSAIEVFQNALDRDPNYALAYAGLGESYWQKYELTHERQWVGKALEACQRASRDGAGHACLGVLYNGTGRYEEAAAEFQSGLETDPTSDDAYRGLAAAYERMGRAAEAEQTYRRAISIRPEYWSGYSYLGAFFYNQGRYEEAAKAFAQVTTLAPDNIRGYNNLGGIYLALGRYADAIPIFERSVSIRPNEDAYSNLGMAYFLMRRFADASRVCEQAVKLDGRQFSLWANLASAYYWEPGRRKDSVAAYRKATALGEEELLVNPRNGVLLSHLAVSHAMLGEQKASRSALKKALALAPADATVLFNAALVSNQFGDERKAIVWLRKSVGAGQSLDLVRNTIDFDNLHSSKSFQELLRGKDRRQ